MNRNTLNSKSLEQGHKFCKYCNKDLLLSYFRLVPKSRKNSDVKVPYQRCRLCESEYDKARRKDDPERFRVAVRKCTKKNKEKYRVHQRIKYRENIEEYKLKGRIKGAKYRKSQSYKEYRINFGRKYVSDYTKNRKKTDPVFKLAQALRCRVGNFLAGIKIKKDKKLKEYLGCDLESFKKHIEAQFKSGMTWDNHGIGSDKWHLDHVIPLASAKTEEEVYKLNHYTNFQPLWQPDNLSKSDKMPIDITS